MTYSADIQATERPGIFEARLRSSTIFVRGADPEHALCYAMTQVGLPDGEIQFWRGATPTLPFRSVHRTGEYRIELGDRFPYCRRKRRSGEKPEISRTGGHQDSDFAMGPGNGTKTESRAPK
jgi:hypothetical protein